jgi:hypothetical protein
MSVVKSVSFLFKQKQTEEAPTVIVKTYPEEVTEENGVFSIPFAEQETRRFKADENFYCDPKITFQDGKIPETKILTLFCNPTLWGVNDD